VQPGAYDLIVTPAEITAEIRIGPGDWPDAVSDTDGYQVVVAGPGTGKTEFLVRRVAHLIESGLAGHNEIAVLCFSRRAAASLRKRVEDATGNTGLPVDVSTFHSLALRLGEELTGGSVPAPMTTPEQVAMVAKVLSARDPEEWPLTYRGILGSPAFASEVADFMMRCSERLLTPDDLAVLAEQRADWRGLPGLYRQYLAELEATGRTDYAVLMATAVRQLSEPDGEAVSARYRYVLVDEYQDSTPAQAEFARLLSRVHRNLTVTGDPYQSIYSFRGAELRNIADFGDRHPGARRIILTDSFRVPEEIMTAALRVVAGGELPGAAGPVKPAPHPGRSEAYLFDQETAEAEWISEQVEHAILVEGISPSRIAVLVRSKKELLTELSRALARRGVAHDSPNSRLVDHPAIAMVRSLVAAAVGGGSLRGATNAEATTADRAMRQVLLGPAYALPLGRERSLLRARRRTWEPWARVIAERAPEYPGLAALLADPSWATGLPAADGFWHVWSILDGVDTVVHDPERAEWRQAWASFAQALGRQAERDPHLDLASYFALTEEDDFEAEPMLAIRTPGERVALTTLHQAKGLEFDIVFIANASEGVFPDLRRSRRMLRPELLSPERTIDPNAQHRFQVQEEMRLAYTAMTRARIRVVWTATSAAVDQGEKRPSRFLLAAANSSLDRLGPPAETQSEPVTVAEAQTMLRRWILDPYATTPSRLAAASVLASHAGALWDPHRFAGVSTRGPDDPILPDTLTLSPSQAGAFRNCPRHYALERRLRLGSNENQYTEFGSRFHEVMEIAESEVLGLGMRHNTLERALEVVDEVWETADFGTPQLNQAHRKRARKAIAHLYSNWPGKGEPIALEHRVETTIGNVTWLGSIDRVEKRDGGVAIIDYKTSGSAATQEAVDTSLQLGFYALAWDGPEEVVAAEFWYPRAKGNSVATRAFPMHLTADIGEELEQITHDIAKEAWEPIVGNHCQHCQFRMSCPAWPEGRGAYLP
jgi:superfamily I DNA/RNA helicase/RecB family exonuclease